MEVDTFGKFIRICRSNFRSELEKRKGEPNGFPTILKYMLENCCSTFEEETLKENLQEEFREYMNSIAA